jgi:tetratricopeptide (TPR) repeat protein
VPLTTGILACLLVVWLTAPAGVRELSLDDLPHLRDYPARNAALSALQVARLPHWQEVAGDSLWRPIPKLLWRATAPLAARTDTRVHAAVTALLAALCAGLLACVLLTTAPLGSRAGSAAVFALVPVAHLLSADVLLPFVGQADLLAAAGVLGACLCWMRAGRLSLALGMACFAAALLSKESSYPAVVALPVAVACCGRGAARQRRRRASVVFGLALLLMALRVAGDMALVGSSVLPAGAGGARLAPGERAVGPVETLGRYAIHIVFPTLPQTDYSFLKQPAANGRPGAAARVAGGVCVLALAAGALWLTRPRWRATRRNAGALRARRAMAAALAWIILFLAPYLNIVPFGALWGGRFAFLPIVGFAWLLFTAAPLLPVALRQLPLVYAVAILGAGAWQMPGRASDFRDPQTLWEAEVRRRPDHAFAWKNLAAYLQRTGNLTAALEAVTRATNLWPQFGEAWLARGQIHRAAGDDEAAASCFERAAQFLPPDHADLLIEQARLAATHRDFTAAAERLERVLRNNPGNHHAQQILDSVRRDMTTTAPR